MNINAVTIVGANGTLGSGVAGIFASFGDAKVYMIARTKEKAESAIRKAGMSVKALSICDNMEAKTYEDLEECVRNSDFIIETVAEDYEIKEKIHKQIDKYMGKDGISSSVTSGISINKLAECYNNENKKRFLGVHFFNPPYNLQLCELIVSDKTDKDTTQELDNYLTNVLYRKTIKTRDTAGFLANKIGFRFINQAMQYAEKYKDKGGIDYIDSILGCFTGRNMPPLRTADFVRTRYS